MELHRSGLLVDEGQDTTISCFCIPLFYGRMGIVLAFGIFGSEEAAEIIIQFIVLLSLMLGTGWSIRKRCFSAF